MKKKNEADSYLSPGESRTIARSNRRLTRRLEKQRRDANADPSRYMTSMQNPGNIVEFDQVSTWFFTDSGTVKAVDGISFDIPRRATVGILGESGCGKSVASLSLMQLLPRPQGQTVGGEIRFNMGDGKAYNLVNAPYSEMMKIRGSKVSMIFQEPMTSLNPVFRCGMQVDEVIALHLPQKTKADVKARTIHLLELVGITDAGRIYTMYPHELSGGMRQRVMIAMALACSPELIIADEPTTALDVTIQAQILGLLRELKERIDSSILLVTHDLGVIASMADFIVVMYAGRIVEKGTTAEIFHDPRHPYTIGLMRAKPVIGQKVDTLYTIPGSVPSPIRLPNHCYFRDRCEQHTEKCNGPYPPEIKLSDTHVVSCWRCENDGKILGFPSTLNGEAL